jgi:hypothetical protein
MKSIVSDRQRPIEASANLQIQNGIQALRIDYTPTWIIFGSMRIIEAIDRYTASVGNLVGTRTNCTGIGVSFRGASIHELIERRATTPETLGPRTDANAVVTGLEV